MPAVELHAYPRIRLHADGASKVKPYPCEISGEYNEEVGAAEYRGNTPYKDILVALLWLSQGSRSINIYAASQCPMFAQKSRMGFEEDSTQPERYNGIMHPVSTTRIKRSNNVPGERRSSQRFSVIAVCKVGDWPTVIRLYRQSGL